MALYAGSHFQGHQSSQSQNYHVRVVLHHVDLDNSTLSGYLTIVGLAEKYAELTTFFEGEIIGDKFSFLTRKWDANEVVDRTHWQRFSEFTPYVSTFNSDNFREDFRTTDFLFMRWKEQFLIPDHRVRHVTGASYEGFYYICYRKSAKKFEGLYYHQSSEKFQRLEMVHVPDTVFPSYSFH